MKKSILNLIMVGFLGLFLSGCTQSGDQTGIVPAPGVGGPQPASAPPAEGVNPSSGALGAGLDKAVAKDDKASEDDEKTVVVNVGNLGRNNPFRPYVQKSLLASAGLGNLPMINVGALGLPTPPPGKADPNLESLSKVKVGGILYAGSSSSAILNFNGEDYLVHKNDSFQNYRIKDITPNEVVVSYGSNEYRASIGQLIDGTVNAVPVASNSFGSRKIKVGNSTSESTYTFSVK